MTLWDEVDERVLRWVFTLPPSLEHVMHELDVGGLVPFEPLAPLTTREVHDALGRLRSYGLIDGRHDVGQQMLWYDLRVTAHGMIVLGEWPDLDRVATAASLHRLLTAISESAPAEAQSALRRAAGTVSRTADAVLRSTVADVAGHAAKDAIDE